MILDANTIINPRAVVIKAFYTLIANAAMARSLCSYYFTIWTK
jgi:hypothetical protein